MQNDSSPSNSNSSSPNISVISDCSEIMKTKAAVEEFDLGHSSFDLADNQSLPSSNSGSPTLSEVVHNFVNSSELLNESFSEELQQQKHQATVSAENSEDTEESLEEYKLRVALEEMKLRTNFQEKLNEQEQKHARELQEQEQKHARELARELQEKEQKHARELARELQEKEQKHARELQEQEQKYEKVVAEKSQQLASLQQELKIFMERLEAITKKKSKKAIIGIGPTNLPSRKEDPDNGSAGASDPKQSSSIIKHESSNNMQSNSGAATDSGNRSTNSGKQKTSVARLHNNGYVLIKNPYDRQQPARLVKIY